MADAIRQRCKCKRGRCPECGSSCRRCGCACDGTFPAVALATKPGKRGRNKYAYANFDQERAADRTKEPPTPKVNEELTTGDDINDLCTAFGVAASERYKLPSKRARQEGTFDELSTDQQAASKRIFLSAASRCAEVIFPAAPDALFDTSVTHRMQSKAQTLPDLIEAAATIVEKAPSFSVQGRVAKAILVKGLKNNKNRRKVQEKHPVFLTGGAVQAQAYNDYNLMANGELLEKAERHIVRYNRETLQSAVDFILSPANVGTLPGGTRVVKLS